MRVADNYCLTLVPVIHWICLFLLVLKYPGTNLVITPVVILIIEMLERLWGAD